MSTGSIVEDYRFLLKYMKKCIEKGLNCTQLIPSSRLLGDLQVEIERGPLSLEKVVQWVKERVGGAVICELCVEVFRELYGVDVNCEDAQQVLLKELAGWYIEILEALGYVKVKYSWKP